MASRFVATAARSSRTLPNARNEEIVHASRCRGVSRWAGA
jgi:hypothetical protein